MTRLDEIEQRLDALERAPKSIPRAFYDEHGRLFLQFGSAPPVRVPCMVDRGVYEAGQRYLRGDGVTWDGHYWVARLDGATKEPGSGDDAREHWRMAVRRGKAAKRDRDRVGEARL